MKFIFPVLLSLNLIASAATPEAGAGTTERVSEDWAQASLPAKPPARLADLAPTPERDWKQHIFTRDSAENYNCALSFAIGGELKPGGYLGAKALGQTLNLNRSAAK
jgi:hypothetical protein